MADPGKYSLYYVYEGVDGDQIYAGICAFTSVNTTKDNMISKWNTNGNVNDDAHTLVIPTNPDGGQWRIVPTLYLDGYPTVYPQNLKKALLVRWKS